jgi:hypothetical protein
MDSFPDPRCLIGFFIENISQTPGMSGSARKASRSLSRIADASATCAPQRQRRCIAEH